MRNFWNSKWQEILLEHLMLWTAAKDDDPKWILLSLSLSHLPDDFAAVIDDDGIGQALKPPCVCCGGCGRWWWVSLLLGGRRPSSSSSWFDFASAFASSAIATTTPQDDIDANSSSMGMLHFDLHLDPAINDLSGKQMMMILSCWSTSTESFLFWVGESVQEGKERELGI